MKLHQVFAFILIPLFTYAQKDLLIENNFPFKVLSDIHNFDFIKARKNIDLSEDTISREEYLFLKVNYYWWAYVISNDNPSYRDSLRYYLNKSNDFYKTANNNYGFIALMINGFDYRLAFKEGRFIDGMLSARKMARKIQKSLDSAEYSPYYKLTAAIYLFSTGYGKEKYWYLYPYFISIPEGDMQKGINYLQELSENTNTVLATEATYTLMRIYKDLYSDYFKAYRLSKKLILWHPDNLFYLALHLQTKEKLNLLTEKDKIRYNKIYRQTVFLNNEAKQYFKNWRNIK